MSFSFVLVLLFTARELFLLKKIFLKRDESDCDLSSEENDLNEK